MEYALLPCGSVASSHFIRAHMLVFGLKYLKTHKPKILFSPSSSIMKKKSLCMAIHCVILKSYYDCVLIFYFFAVLGLEFRAFTLSASPALFL
jgi:hypothetical protein